MRNTGREKQRDKMPEDPVMVFNVVSMLHTGGAMWLPRLDEEDDAHGEDEDDGGEEAPPPRAPRAVSRRRRRWLTPRPAS